MRATTATNLGFTLLKAGLMFVGMTLAARWMRPEILGVVLLARRWAGFISNFAQLGFSQSILRYFSGWGSALVVPKRLIGSVVAAILTVMLLLSGASLFMGEPLAEFLFGESSSQSLVWVSLLLTFGLILNYFSFSLWLSRLKVVRANFSEVMAVSGWFLVIVLFVPASSAQDFLLLLAWLTLISSSVGIIWFFLSRQVTIKSAEDSQERVGFAEFFRFGLPRATGAAFDSATLLICAWFLRAHPNEAASVIMALVVLRLLQTLITPVAQIWSISLAGAKNNNESHQHQFDRVVSMADKAVMLALAIVLITFPMLDYLVVLWLGQGGLAQSVVSYLSWWVWAIPVVVFYYTVRPTIDLYFELPWNPMIQGLALVAFMLVAYFSIRTHAPHEEAARLGQMAIFSIYLAAGFVFRLAAFRQRSRMLSRKA